jgi:HPt (histidine-containing phosphotransfer) domain-containing protein
MINWNKIKDLKNEIGEEDFEEVVELFLEEVDGAISKLREKPDRNSLEEDLHFLKGSALNLGFSEFSTLCQSGETRAASGDTKSINVDEILATYEASRGAFVSGLSSLQ